MFIRQKTSRGCTAYQAVESYRDKDGQIHQRVVAHLGTSPTISEAFSKYEARYFASRKGKRRAPFTEADRKAWVRLRKLEQLLIKDKDFGYQRTAAFQAEIARWRRTIQREDQQREESDWSDPMLDETDSCYAILGLTPEATVDQITAAYRRKARECHPDHGGSDAAMAAVNEAYERLMS